MLAEIETAATEQPEGEGRQLLQQTAGRLMEVFPRMFKQFMIDCRDKLPQELAEVGQTQLGLFHALSHRDCTISELARKQNVTAPTISRMVDTLVGRGLIERRQDAADRRIIWLSLTPRGHEVQDSINAAIHEAVATFMGPLRDDELSTVIAALDVLDHLAQRQKEAHKVE